MKVEKIRKPLHHWISAIRNRTQYDLDTTSTGGIDFPRSQLVPYASAITGSSSPLVWTSCTFAQQRTLLEPFGTLHGIKNLEIASIDGKTERFDTQLMKEVKERAGRPPPSMEEATITTTKTAGHGNEALRTRDFLRACVLYKDIIHCRYYIQLLHSTCLLADELRFFSHVSLNSAWLMLKMLHIHHPKLPSNVKPSTRSPHRISLNVGTVLG